MAPVTKAVRDGARNSRQERVDRRPSSGVDLDSDLELNPDLDRELAQRTVAVGAAAVVGVPTLLLTAGAIAAVRDAPRVAGTGSAFGEVTAETAAVETDDETR